MVQRIHHKALKVAYGYIAPYNELLQIDKKLYIYQRYLRSLNCEVFKSINNLNSESMRSSYTFKKHNR